MDLSGDETDEMLAVAGAAGVHEAFEALVRRHGAGVQTPLERTVGHHHDAWDLTQEVWIKVHRSLGGFDARRPFRPWLMQIALNQGRDALRRGGRTGVTTSIGGDDSLPAAVADPSERLLERAEIEHALGRVAEPFREALVLVDVLGLTYFEAAQTLACAVGTVKSRVGRGRAAFRCHYGRVQDEGDSHVARVPERDTRRVDDVRDVRIVRAFR